MPDKENRPDPLGPEATKTGAPGTENQFIARAVPNPAKPLPLTIIRGYRGASSEAEKTRIYLDSTISSYVDIPEADIAFEMPVPSEVDPLGAVNVWIKQDSKIDYRTTSKEAGGQTAFTRPGNAGQVSFAFGAAPQGATVGAAPNTLLTLGQFTQLVHCTVVSPSLLHCGYQSLLIHQCPPQSAHLHLCTAPPSPYCTPASPYCTPGTHTFPTTPQTPGTHTFPTTPQTTPQTSYAGGFGSGAAAPQGFAFSPITMPGMPTAQTVPTYPTVQTLAGGGVVPFGAAPQAVSIPTVQVPQTLATAHVSAYPHCLITLNLQHCPSVFCPPSAHLHLCTAPPSPYCTPASPYCTPGTHTFPTTPQTPGTHTFPTTPQTTPQTSYAGGFGSGAAAPQGFAFSPITMPGMPTAQTVPTYPTVGGGF